MRYRLQRRRRLGCALSIALLGATTTGRKAAAEDITAVYSAFWAGLPAGQIRVKLRDSGSGYSDEIEISTQGLPRLFTRFRATALAEGRRVADRPAEPSHYLAVYDLWKRRDSRVSMQFVNHTGTMIAERGPDDTSRKPPLAEAFRENAVDPLSAIERIRGAFRAAGRVGSFTIPVYDGARRFDIVGKILPKQISSDAVLRAELTLRAIAELGTHGRAIQTRPARTWRLGSPPIRETACYMRLVGMAAAPGQIGYAAELVLAQTGVSCQRRHSAIAFR